MSHDNYFEEGDAFEESGFYEKAFAAFLAGAKSGSTSCMKRLASLYTMGKGMGFADFDEAIEWEKRAVEAGDKTALFNLGVSYRMVGKVLQAKACFESALKAGDNSAALELAKLYAVSEKEALKVEGFLKQVIQDTSLCEADHENAKRLLSEYKTQFKGA
jgi:tetratricopeptide (TPR) repeat protein